MSEWENTVPGPQPNPDLGEASEDPIQILDLADRLLQRGTFGKFRLRRILGRGGMGVVFLAQQVSPIQREVALKIVQPCFGSAEIVSRFRLEMQALARMNHRNIASVFEAGVNEEGLPYFSMEYVDGQPITEYCDDRRLDTTQRLALFMDVCRAVRHAHLKGVIHRDIKPSNVLVKEVDGLPEPKVIDFGIAKAMTADDPCLAKLTVDGGLVGTPAYMSPEQIQGVDVGVRSDVYSLSMVLYELLVDRLPFADETFSRGNVLYQVFLAHRSPIMAPSQRLAGLGAETRQLARLRSSSVRAWKREINGDLDAIVLKGLEKKCDDRYSSVGELLADLLAYLRHEPLSVGPDSTGRKARKWIRRHRIAAGLACVISLFALLGIGGLGWGWVRAVEAQNLARLEAEHAEQTAQFLESIFLEADPDENRASEITAHELPYAGAKRMQAESHLPLKVKTRLLQTMGKVYWKLGFYEEAEALYRSAQDVWKQAPTTHQLGYASLLADMSDLYRIQARYPLAEQTALDSLHIRQDLAPDAPGSLGQSFSDLGVCYFEWGRYDEAEKHYRRSLDLLTQAGEGHEEERGHALNGLAITLSQLGRQEEAVDFQHRALELREKVLGVNHPDLAQSLMNLGLLKDQLGQKAEARELYERALDIWTRTLGVHHLRVGIAKLNLGELLREEGDETEARDCLEESLKIFRDRLGSDHHYLAFPLVGLAQLTFRTPLMLHSTLNRSPECPLVPPRDSRPVPRSSCERIVAASPNSWPHLGPQ